MTRTGRGGRREPFRLDADAESHHPPTPVGTWTPGLRIPRADCGHFPGSAAFTPDSKTVAVWTRPGQIGLFGLPGGVPYATLPVTVRTGSIATHGELRFSRDGSRLVAVADQARVQLWDIAGLRRQLAKVGLDWEVSP